MNANGLTWTGRALAWLWAGFWLWFALMSVLGGKHILDGLAHLAVPGLLMIAAAVAVWFRPAAGGILLLAEGFALAMLIAARYLQPNSPTRALFLALALVAPPVAAGVLLLLGRRPRVNCVEQTHRAWDFSF